MAYAFSRVQLIRWPRMPPTEWALLHAPQRQAERERRAHPQLTLHPDLSTVQLDELPTQRQTQPSALHLLVSRPHLPELLEHRLLILRSDAHAGVADRDFNQAVLWHRPDLDPPTFRRELDRIRQQIQHDLADLPLVRLDLA